MYMYIICLYKPALNWGPPLWLRVRMIWWFSMRFLSKTHQNLAPPKTTKQFPRTNLSWWDYDPDIQAKASTVRPISAPSFEVKWLKSVSWAPPGSTGRGHGSPGPSWGFKWHRAPVHPLSCHRMRPRRQRCCPGRALGPPCGKLWDQTTSELSGLPGVTIGTLLTKMEVS